MESMPSGAPGGGESGERRGGIFEPPALDAWEVELECFRCGRPLPTPYRNVRSGVVLRCPSCRGSYVVRMDLYARLNDLVRVTYNRLNAEYERLRAEGRTGPELEQRWNDGARNALALFRRAAAEIRPAGAPRARAGAFG